MKTRIRVEVFVDDSVENAKFGGDHIINALDNLGKEDIRYAFHAFTAEEDQKERYIYGRSSLTTVNNTIESKF